MGFHFGNFIYIITLDRKNNNTVMEETVVDRKRVTKPDPVTEKIDSQEKLICVFCLCLV